MKASRSGVLLLAVAAGMVGVFVDSANAVIMDQIGTSPTFVTSSDAYLSDVFGSAHATDDSAVVDDFTVSGPAVLVKVYAAVDGFGSSFVSFSDVTKWNVGIYSSLAAADSSLVGDVYSHSFAPADVVLTNPFGGSSTSALFNASTEALLPAAGTYYLAVSADNAFSNGEVGVYATTGVSNANPGGLNAYQVNPAGGLGLPDNEDALGLDAAYAVVGVAVPEPSPITITVAALGVLGLSRRRSSRPL